MKTHIHRSNNALNLKNLTVGVILTAAALMGFAPVIASAATYTVSATPTTVTPGGTVTVNWAAPSNHSTTDWVSVYSPGAPNTSYNDWKYVPAGTNGTLTLTAPTATGTYEVRYLLNDGYTDAAKSSPIIAQHLTPEPPADTVLTNVPPMVIDGKKDVVIRNVRVSNPNGSCIQIKNSAQDIRIENSEIGPCRDHGIDVTGSYGIIVYNSYIHDTTGNSIQTYKASAVTVYNNRLERGSSGVYAALSIYVWVDHNRFLNAKGPMPRGQFVQFNGVTGKSNRINCNVGENIMGQSYPEDAINLYKSSGDPTDPIQITGNKIKGGGPSTSSSGISAGDSAGAYVLIKDNILVDSGAVGIGIGGGHDIQALNNLIYARQQPFTNVGVYVWNWNNYDPNCYSHTVQGNSVNWTHKAGFTTPNWDGGNCGPIAGWDDNTWDSNIDPSIEDLTILSCSQ